MTRIYQSDSTATWHECEACLVTLYCLIGEVLEDLLERSLAHTVLLDVHFFLVCLDLTEQVANSLVIARHTNLVEVATLLNKLNLRELTRQQGNKLEAIHLDEEVLEQSRQPDFSIVQVSLYM